MAESDVALCVFGTGRYAGFVPALADSARAHFLPAMQPRIIAFADRPIGEADTTCHLSHMPWPMGTLLRYHYLAAEPCLRHYRYVFMCDADARFVGDVHEAILGRRVATLGVHHIRLTPDQYPYCINTESVAYIPPGQGQYYYIGGFQGGDATAYLADCATLADMIHTDLGRRVIPVWHDESYWNRYLLDHPPDITLPWGFCANEHDRTADTKLLALSKDHDAYRAWRC